MTFWVDKNYRRYWKSEVDNRYLINIANALTKGTGHIDFCTTEKIDDIFEECYLRGLMTADEAHEKCMKAIDAMIKKREEEAIISAAEASWDARHWDSD